MVPTVAAHIPQSPIATQLATPLGPSKLHNSTAKICLNGHPGPPEAKVPNGICGCRFALYLRAFASLGSRVKFQVSNVIVLVKVLAFVEMFKILGVKLSVWRTALTSEVFTVILSVCSCAFGEETV